MTKSSIKYTNGGRKASVKLAEQGSMASEQLQASKSHLAMTSTTTSWKQTLSELVRNQRFSANLLSKCQTHIQFAPSESLRKTQMAAVKDVSASNGRPETEPEMPYPLWSRTTQYINEPCAKPKLVSVSAQELATAFV
jgi:hypothetical protein